MTEEKAIQEAGKIINSDQLSIEKIKEFFLLEKYIADYIFGDLIEALIVVAPLNLIDAIANFEQ